MLRRSFNQGVKWSLLAGACAMVAVVAMASESGNRYGGENRGKPLAAAQANAKWQQECGSCHIAYAPGLLGAASWQKVMAGLEKHFGADASLDAASAREITDYLVRHASNRWTANTAPPRITSTGWFKAKHSSREIDPNAWNRPSIKSASNCGACHPGAERGNFNEHDIRIPRN